MGDRFGSSKSRQTTEPRSSYYGLKQDDSINLAAASNMITTAPTTTTSATTSNTICMFIDGHRIQQRFKLLTDGLMQVCRVPHAKNILEKIRFSRFLRRWEDHHVHLEQNEISSQTVC